MKEEKWLFINDEGKFVWKNPRMVNELYFPLCNEAGFMASITPRLNGDAKTGQNSFVTLPITMEDLHNNRSARNFWIYHKDWGAISLTGNSAKQLSETFSSPSEIEEEIVGDFLSHTLIRNDKKHGIRSEITNFCPVSDDTLEIMMVKITNTSSFDLSFVPTCAIPLYGRSADNLRDHRHVTSLIHRLFTYPYGMSIKPMMHHDERGHEPNQTSYFVIGVEENGTLPVGQFPTVHEFIGEQGTLDWPEAVVRNLPCEEILPHSRDGKEAIGALRFQNVTLAPNESKEYVVLYGACEEEEKILQAYERYASGEKAHFALENNHKYWKNATDYPCIHTADSTFDSWLHWVNLQPLLRKIYGCSFLPHHDYGRGGRGWRDLWQDLLALILVNPSSVRPMLVANFSGVRLDGSNATIILNGLGNFAADRNRISRVWMDHGVWPWNTTKLYLDQTGDFDLLFEENSYFQDRQLRRAKKIDLSWKESDGTKKTGADGKVYLGSVLEKILVQHLTIFYHVGEHGNLLLEGADWNDTLDMASEKGESVPFTAFYGANLISLAKTLQSVVKKTGRKEVELFPQMEILLEDHPWASYEEKWDVLNRYYDSVETSFTGEKKKFVVENIIDQLMKKGEELLEHVREQEWVKTSTGQAFFNGYYNNDGERVDGEQEDGIHMNLTAQTFAMMSKAASDEQVASSYQAAQEILKDPQVHGYRLTTPLGKNTWNFGRGFSFAYGEKEAGGIFSHMVVMFANALYQRNFVEEGYEVLHGLYELSVDAKKAKIYPGIPEYFSLDGQGKYHYVTGAASWFILTLMREMFGFQGEEGDLLLRPKLRACQFDAQGICSLTAFFAGKKMQVIYQNENHKEYGEYQITSVQVNGKDYPCVKGNCVRFKKEDFSKLWKEENIIRVILK